MYLDYIILCIVSLFIFELREPLLKFQRNEMPVMFSFLSRPDHRILLPGIFPFEGASKNSYEAPIVENNNYRPPGDICTHALLKTKMVILLSVSRPGKFTRFSCWLLFP